ncbi:MAG TPA: hypothetical protein VF795_03175 [Desulfuromonadaceae bacterium]
MTPGGITLNVDLMSSQFGAAGSVSSGQDTNSSAQAPDKIPTQDTSLSAMDTVTITNKSQGPAPAANKDKPNSENSKQDQSARTMKDVLFAYNFKGKLRIRFMDSANRLIYQIPPVMVARTQDLMQRSDLAVDMRA